MGPAAASSRASIAKSSIARLPKEPSAPWRTACSELQDAAVVDARHQVLVFRVHYASSLIGAGAPARLTKYSDREDHAPYRAESLKLATLRHYREQHQDLEGICNPMEGRSRIASTLDEMCRRHGVHTAPRDAQLVATNVTYKVEDTNLIYCTSRTNLGTSWPDQWRFASRIRDVPGFALLLGVEFARQFDRGRNGTLTDLDRLFTAIVQSSGSDSTVLVHHGPVVYEDNAGEILFARIPEHARGLAAHFFKRTEFKDQQEYRFVFSAQGSRPVEGEFYLHVTPELRSVFEKS